MSSESNPISDFPPDKLTVRLLCDACGHQANLDATKVPNHLTVHELPKQLHCTSCGSRECTIRIIYTGSGGYSRS